MKREIFEQALNNVNQLKDLRNETFSLNPKPAPFTEEQLMGAMNPKEIMTFQAGERVGRLRALRELIPQIKVQMTGVEVMQLILNETEK